MAPTAWASPGVSTPINTPSSPTDSYRNGHSRHEPDFQGLGNGGAVGPLDGTDLDPHIITVSNGHGHSHGSSSSSETFDRNIRSTGISEDPSGSGVNSKTPSTNGTGPSIKPQPIAIIGMACRMPGNVASPAEFWELCTRARTGFTPIPKERFNHDTFHHPNPGKSGTYNTVGGNFLNIDLAAFDAPFFGLTEKEAISMDPQQRLLLECTFEALENAGIPKHTIVGKDMGVFVGGSFAEYESHLFRDSDTIPMHQATGCAHAMQSNRISHFFDLRGPSFTTDTACSSSLIALHLACQSLRAGETHQALVGGCHLNMLPEFWISFSTCRLLSDSGRSIAFDQRGTGFGRGEGCGMIVLKPLDQAVKDNDPIRAVIVGTGINQDGKTPGITMPSGEAQEALMRQVYTTNGLDPLDVGFVEAHGTGTRVGDPIEARAIHNVLGQGRTAKDPLWIGSVKSNIGHLEAASGIAAVIKSTMMLERGFILPNYDFKYPNEKIPWKQWRMKVPSSQRPWPRGKKYISVNNFGFGGANAHVVLAKAPFSGRSVVNAPADGLGSLNGLSKELASARMAPTRRLFVLTANDKSSLAAVMKNLVVYLEQRPEIFQMDLMKNIAYTLGQRRSILQWRIAIPALKSFELIEALTNGKVAPGKEVEPLRLGFIFTGQGAQWWGMGRELYEQYPIFHDAIDRADRYLRHLGANWSLLEELRRDAKTSKVSQAHISQPSCTAIQIALVDLLHSWNITPSAVAGHSSGEIGAAYAASIINFDSAMAIAYHRGRLIPILKDNYPELNGAMMAVGSTKEEVQPIIDSLPEQGGQMRIACYNSPISLTISGDEAALADLEKAVEEKQMFNRRLLVDTAYHSHHMNLIAKEYRACLQELPLPRSTGVRFHSSLYGHLMDGSDCRANYWVENLTCPVRFSEALESMIQPKGEFKTGVNMLIELGPHSALQGPIKQTLKAFEGSASKIPYAPSLVRKRDAVEAALDLAAALVMKGAMLDMDAINFPKPTKQPILLTDLPRYTWNHQNKYWQESRMTKMHKHKPCPRNDIIGSLARYSNDLEPTWRNIVHLDDLPWLRHHRIQSLTMFPMAGFISMALEAAAQWSTSKSIHFDKIELRDLSIIKPLVLPDSDIEMTITMRPHQEATLVSSDLWNEFRICSWSHSNNWTEHCVGLIATHASDRNDVDSVSQDEASRRVLALTMEAIESSGIVAVPDSDMYDALTALGIAYGPTFQGVKNCKASDTCSAADVIATDIRSEMPNHYMTDTILHPTFLESLIELYWPILGAGRSKLDTVYLASSLSRMSVRCDVSSLSKDPGSTLKAFCKAEFLAAAPRATKITYFATASNDSTQAVIEIDDLIVSPILDGETELGDNAPRELCYKLEWEPVLEGPCSADEESSSLQQPADAVLPETPVVIVHDESNFQQLVASGIANALERATSRLPDMGTLYDVNPDGKICIVLTEIDQPFLANLSEEQFNKLRHMLATVQGVLWAVRGAYNNSTSPDSNLIVGLSRTVRSETLLPFAILDLDDRSALPETATVDSIMSVFRAAFNTNTNVQSEMEFTERSGHLFTPRIINDNAMDEYVHRITNPAVVEPQPFGRDDRPLKMELSTPGAVETVHFIANTLVDGPIVEDEVEFEVKAIGMNYRDITVGKGHVANAEQHTLGIEAAGIVTSVGRAVSSFRPGDRIAALTFRHGAFATRTRAAAALTFKIPASVLFEEAASMPLAYTTAYYALIEQGRLSEGDSVLIHAAAGAVGQAAINLAQMIGAEIYATVGSAEKKALLMEEYGLPDNHIFYSRTASFGPAVRAATGGRGVDVLMNTLIGADATRESWACLGRFGRFVDLGRREGDNISRLEMSRFDGGNASIICVDMFALASERPKVMKKLVADVAHLLRYCKIRPISPVTTFPISDVEGAFKSLQTGKTFGKLVVVPHSEDIIKATPSKLLSNLLKPNATYILIGGTGGLGRSMARWMVSNGARNIVLLSRRGSSRGKVGEMINELNVLGANIVVHSCDVADKSSVDSLLSSVFEGLPPVRGVVHGSMVLRDVLFEKMSYEDYTTVIESKVAGAWNFHRALEHRKIPLDFFVAISSAAGAVGNRGQAAYAAANCFLNAFVQYRLSQGLPAACLDLTAISDTGYLADDKEKAAEVARNLGSDSICEAEVLALLGAAISGRTVCCNHHVITGMRITPSMQPFWTPDAKFKHLRLAMEELAAAEAGANANGAVSFNAQLKAAKTLADAEEAICRGLVDKIAAVLMLDAEDMDVTRSLSNYPLDSLVAIEIRNFITREFEANLQVLELLSSGSIQTLAKGVCAKSKLCAGLT